MFNLDLGVIMIIDILVVLLLTGFVSLCERRILAIVQIRIGPALFLFGLLTPVTDGIKLFLKFVLFVAHIEIVHLVGSVVIGAMVIFIAWFFLPVGFILFLDQGFTVFLLLYLHLITNVFSVFLVGFFLFTTCFVYISAMRTLFFSILCESLIFMLFTTIYLLDFFSFLSIRDTCVDQIHISNCFVLGLLFCGIFWVAMLVDSLKLPFDYMECESELVAGLITELSGIFFVVYSVIEINHTLVTTILFVSFCFGGLFVCFKAILVLIFGFLWPRVIGMRIKVTTAQSFILLFLFIISLLLFSWLVITKILTILT